MIISDSLEKQMLYTNEGARWIIESMEVQKVDDCYYGEFYDRRLHQC